MASLSRLRLICSPVGKRLAKLHGTIYSSNGLIPCWGQPDGRAGPSGGDRTLSNYSCPKGS